MAFRLETQDLSLPKGAFSGARRHILHWHDRPLIGVTEGTPRCYVYPVFTLDGFAVTAESPADHPHHNSIWIAADHVHCAAPAEGGAYDSYTYNFYVNDTFQGRAPGSQETTALEGIVESIGRFTIVADIVWRGPPEWGAPTGRAILCERRRITVQVAEDRRAYTIDLATSLTASSWAVTLGPTRHAFFNARVADVMLGANGLQLRDAEGSTDAETINRGSAEWVSASGPVGGGHQAGLVVWPGEEPRSWFVTDWGVVTVGSMRTRAVALDAGETLSQTCRVLVHDGPFVGWFDD